MKWIDRYLAKKIEDFSKNRPAIFLGGVRQAGKSSLLKTLFPEHAYVTLDHVDQAMEASENPRHFLTKNSRPLIIDEVQYAPQLFRELKILIDEDRHHYGRFFLTGSQRFHLMKGIQESLAGRLAILHLETLGAAELRKAGFENLSSLFYRGGYPELWIQNHIHISSFYEDYLQTYLNRDLQHIIGVEKIRDYRRFLGILAARVGNLLNHADISKDVGVNVATIKEWMSALEISGIIYLVTPYYANLGKRLIRTPKIYFSDLGLLSHLLRMDSEKDLFSSPLWGAVWENFVFCELIKSQTHLSSQDIYFYRDQNGVEIDFLVQDKSTLHLIEAKGSERPDPAKLNFKKVQPLFAGQKTVCWLACLHQSAELIQLKDYQMINPLKANWILEPEFGIKIV